jgi:hypothetical protein
MLKAVIGRTVVPKFVRPQLKGKKLGVVVHTCHPNDGGNPKIGASQSKLA